MLPSASLAYALSVMLAGAWYMALFAGAVSATVGGAFAYNHRFTSDGKHRS